MLHGELGIIALIFKLIFYCNSVMVTAFCILAEPCYEINQFMFSFILAQFSQHSFNNGTARGLELGKVCGSMCAGTNYRNS